MLYCDKSHYQNFTPPFDIPESWQWVRLGDYVINRDGERVPIASTIRSKQSNKIYDYYGAAGAIDKVDNYIFDERLLLIGEDGANLLSRTKDNAFFADGKYWVNNHAHVLDSSDKFLLEFVALYINTIPLDDYITGSAQPKLSQDNLNNIHLPIPPIEEQRRILTMIESLMSIICEIRESKQQLSQSIALTKSKILDLAMQGKLVPQDPADEPAAEMLRRVNPKAKIITDNPHYPQLPDNWVYLSLSDINTYKSSTVTPANMPEQLFDLYSVPIFSTLTPENIHGGEIGSAKQVINKGDVLLCKINPHLNRVWEIIEDSHNVQIASSEWIVVRSELHHPSFLKWYFNSPEFRALLSSQVSGVGGSLTRAQPAIVKGYLVPVPPMEEQARISKAIEHWFECLDSIISGLSN